MMSIGRKYSTLFILRRIYLQKKCNCTSRKQSYQAQEYKHCCLLNYQFLNKKSKKTRCIIDSRYYVLIICFEKQNRINPL